MDNLSTGAQQVLDALNQIGQGNAAEIRNKTGKAKSTTDKAIRELADAGLIIETEPGDGGPARWSIPTPAEADTNATLDEDTGDQPDADADTATDEEADQDDGEPADSDNTGNTDPGQSDAGTDTSTETTADEKDDEQGAGEDDSRDDNSGQSGGDSPVQTGAVPARPKPPADRRVLAVAGVLGDYPDGATIGEIAEATGYNLPAVARLLQAMEQADAVRRIPPDTEAGTPERWQPGPGKASEVDPNPAPPRCPTCHQVIRNSTFKSATATVRGGSGTVNSDGNEALGRNVLRGWVAEFINANPGHEFTSGDIADALGAKHGRIISPGAVLNNCRTLAMTGQIQVARQEPFTVTANPPADSDSDSDSDNDNEQQ